MQKFKVRRTAQFNKKFKRLSELERKRYRKTLGLLENPAHHSLNTHSYEKRGKGVKGSYTSMRERVFWKMEGTTIWVIDIGCH
jgi:mRNA-degrading endonuclease RelE of RelBE toxin-antitoxin system